MKYLHSIVFLIGFISTVFAQPIDSLEWIKDSELTIGKDEIWSVDGLENVYLTSKYVINKYDSVGELKFSQSIRSLGRPQDIQSINTMKLVVFSEEQQKLCFLDNTLTLSGECLDLSEFNIGNASHIAVSSQSDKIWVMDQLNSKLLLLSLNRTMQFQEIKNVSGLLNVSKIISIQEVNNELFIMDTSSNIYQFDLYGSLINKFDFKDVNDFLVKDASIVLIQNNHLIIHNLLGTEKKIIELPIKNSTEVKISGNFFYFRTENKIFKYSLNLRK